MTIVLGDNQYGKSETRVVRVTRSPGGGPHHITDLSVSIALAGDFEESHLTGDNSKVVPTDTQKNTVFAFAQEAPITAIEEFGLRLARHFTANFEAVRRARVSIEEFAWDPIPARDRPHGHAFMRAGGETRLATVTGSKDEAWVVAGVADLVVLKTTDSEFWGFPRDRYTTLQETKDRILATAVSARWRYVETNLDWGDVFVRARAALLEAFAEHHSLALQHTLYAMGKAALEACREIAEIRLSMPNRHHFLVDLSPFGQINHNEVYFAADRPYGLIEGSVARDDTPAAGLAW